MRVPIVAAVAAALWAIPAGASPLSGDVGMVSDYRYRGLSLSDGRPALQGSLTLEHDGLYGSLWGSTLGRIGDPASSEIDVTAGYERELAGWVRLDVSATRFFYPAFGGDDYSEATAAVTLTRGSAEATGGLSYAPRQRTLRDDAGRRHDNVYAFAGARYPVPKTPLTLVAKAGYERGAFDAMRGGGKWDWNIGAEVERGRGKFGLGCVGSNVDHGKGHALVGSVTLGW